MEGLLSTGPTPSSYKLKRHLVAEREWSGKPVPNCNLDRALTMVLLVGALILEHKIQQIVYLP